MLETSLGRYHGEMTTGRSLCGFFTLAALLSACIPQVVGRKSTQIDAPAPFSYPTIDSMYLQASPISPILPTSQRSAATYSISPALPQGLVLDAATGAVTGTPAVSSARTLYTVTAANAGGSSTSQFHLKTAGASEWTWIAGPTTGSVAGNYGTLGLVSSSNWPGGRLWPQTWTDASGNFWLFGGNGEDSAATNGSLNDLWKFDGSKWTWMGGSQIVEMNGVYGTKGLASASNLPGARTNAVSWLDASGALWLFGGSGKDSVGTHSDLGDLWRLDGTQWTWMGGPNLADRLGVYGTQGTAAAPNWPGGRETHSAWLDPQGNAWIFAGWGCSSTGCNVWLNDLWKFDGTQWTWMKGSNTGSANGTYGTRGVAAPANTPGGRNYSASWTDRQGNLWVFGGNGLDSVGTGNLLNDLWKFDGSAWTWVKGSNLASAVGVWGTKGVTTGTNTPSARRSSLYWADSYGVFWLFGGYGYDSTSALGGLNDLWKFDGTDWTWVSGTQLNNQVPDYSAQGVAGPTPPPGGRRKPAAWIDSSGDFWIFGGFGIDSSNTGNKDLGDLWRFRY